MYRTYCRVVWGMNACLLYVYKFAQSYSFDVVCYADASVCGIARAEHSSSAVGRRLQQFVAEVQNGRIWWGRASTKMLAFLGLVLVLSVSGNRGIRSCKWGVRIVCVVRFVRWKVQTQLVRTCQWSGNKICCKGTVSRFRFWDQENSNSIR